MAPQCGYRLIWGKRDANNNVLLGAPSPLTAVTNTTGGTRNTQSVATIPSGITTSHFYQLYRSAATPSASVSPVDQEQLVAEGFPTGTDLTNGYITITDQTPDSLKGESLYAGSDQEGITQANYQPPLAKDFCFYKGSVLYANTSQRQQLKLAIDGVGSPNGVQSGDVITIAGVAFTADTSENTATGHFQVFTSGTPAQNIADTTNSFIRVVNRYSGNTQVYAYLLSGQSDLPGQMLIEARTAGTATFAVTASANGTAWTPDLPTSGTTVSSSAQTETNVIYVAKYGQPEAVPLANRFPVGAQSNAILRIIPLRDYVVIFTTDGIYRLLGNTIESFDPQPFDLTTRLVAPESAVPLGNQAWCLANQGVVSISDGGVQSRSTLQIDDKIRELLGQAIDSVAARAFAIGYETDHRYILALPQNENDTFCTQQYCINYFTEAWTRWTRSCTLASFIRSRTSSTSATAATSASSSSASRTLSAITSTSQWTLRSRARARPPSSFPMHRHQRRRYSPAGELPCRDPGSRSRKQYADRRPGRCLVRWRRAVRACDRMHDPMEAGRRWRPNRGEAVCGRADHLPPGDFHRMHAELSHRH
jgi:hypothetical protein